MSTRERTIRILDKFNEEQLEYFVKLFESFIYAESKTDISHDSFLELEEMIAPIPDLDDEKELAEYRDEKYGKGIS